MVKINGSEQAAAGKTVAQILSELGFAPEHVAVERNLNIVPKNEYETLALEDGDTVEIVRFVGGG